MYLYYKGIRWQPSSEITLHLHILDAICRGTGTFFYLIFKLRTAISTILIDEGNFWTGLQSKDMFEDGVSFHTATPTFA